MNPASAPGAPTRQLIFATTIALVMVAVSPRSAVAYVLEGASWATGSAVTFQMALGSAGRTLTDGNTSWDVAAAPAATLWNQNVQRVRLVTATNPSAPVSRGDGVNTIAFAATFFGSNFGSNTLAITSWSTRNGATVESDVLFNTHVSWDSYRGTVRYGGNGYAVGEIRRVLLHELGHALGLDHPDQHGQHVSAVMNSMMGNVELPTADDVRGAQSMYGAPSGGGSPTPTPTPSPTPTPPVTTTISVSASPTVVSASAGGTATYIVSTSIVNPTAAVTVNYRMSGRAALGTNYTLSGSPGQVTIPAGAHSANVTLTAVSARRRPKVANMVLISGSGYSVSFPNSASVTIMR
jgi:hypothetical protein